MEKRARLGSSLEAVVVLPAAGGSGGKEPASPGVPNIPGDGHPSLLLGAGDVVQLGMG